MTAWGHSVGVGRLGEQVGEQEQRVAVEFDQRGTGRVVLAVGEREEIPVPELLLGFLRAGGGAAGLVDGVDRLHRTDEDATERVAAHRTAAATSRAVGESHCWLRVYLASGPTRYVRPSSVACSAVECGTWCSVTWVR